MRRNDTKCKYMLFFPLKNLAHKGLMLLQKIQHDKSQSLQTRNRQMLTSLFGNQGPFWIWAQPKWDDIVMLPLIGWAHTQNDPLNPTGVHQNKKYFGGKSPHPIKMCYQALMNKINSPWIELSAPYRMSPPNPKTPPTPHHPTPTPTSQLDIIIIVTTWA